MKNERLLNALGNIDEELIVEAAPGNKTSKMKLQSMKWIKRVVAAACVCLLVAGAINTLGRLDFDFGASCGAGLGKIVDGVYYYHEPHKGIMSYMPDGETKQLLHTYWYEDWQVNEYGIYYRQGMSVYVRDHETGTRTKLYTSDSVENTHMRFVLWEDNNIIVTNYNKNTEIVYEVLVDGVNGGVLETVMEKTSYDETNTVYYSDMHLRVGDREITLEPMDEDREVFIAIENGENILPNDFYVTRHYRDVYENILILNKYTHMNHETVFVIYPDGTNKILNLPYHTNFSGNEEYLYYASVSDETVGCVDAQTGETWLLEIEANGKDYNEIHNVETDGEYMYTCGPAGGETACWKLIYGEDGKPTAMTLLDGDIK